MAKNPQPAAGRTEPKADGEILNSPTGDAAAIIEHVSRTCRVHPVKLPKAGGFDPAGENSLVIVPGAEGLEALDLKPFMDAWRLHPERREGTAVLQDLASFIAHANRFKDEDSALFANIDLAEPGLTAIYDYHPALNTSPDGGFDDPKPPPVPRFCGHRAHYPFPLSDEWQAWKAMDARPMDQADFAAFLEDRLPDVIEPPRSIMDAAVDKGADAGVARAPSERDAGGDFGELSADERLALVVRKLGGSVATPAKLLELSRGLHVNVGATVVNAHIIASGEGEITFKEEHRDAGGAPVKVPTMFLIALPIFWNGARYRVLVRLRYRVRDGGIKWFYQLHDVRRAFDHAVREACRTAEIHTDLPLFCGAPEAQPRLPGRPW